MSSIVRPKWGEHKIEELRGSHRTHAQASIAQDTDQGQAEATIAPEVLFSSTAHGIPGRAAEGLRSLFDNLDPVSGPRRIVLAPAKVIKEAPQVAEDAVDRRRSAYATASTAHGATCATRRLP